MHIVQTKDPSQCAEKGSFCLCLCHFEIYSYALCVRMTCHHMCVEVKEDFCEVVSLLLPLSGFQGLKLRSPGFCGKFLYQMSHTAGPGLCFLKICFSFTEGHISHDLMELFLTHNAGHFSLLHEGQCAVPLFI